MRIVKKVPSLPKEKSIVKFEFIKKNKDKYNINFMCKLLGVSRSGYYAYASRPKSKSAIENEVISDYIKLIFNEHYGRYGCRRIKNALFNNYGLVLSRKRITRLMRAMGLYARGSNYKYKYKKAKNNLATINLINQVFIAEQKNKVWFGDITYIITAEGNLYLSVFIDLYTRKIVGYSLKSHMRTSLV
ncbi:MAG: IS3 family transposase, partial [Candidatus Phytoplasma sp.]|nr:IS3 family transposase [Phytoplasma sp.]